MGAGGCIAVWFSCGAASAVAARLTLDLYGSAYDVRLLNNEVVEEGDDNRRFLRDCEQWLGHPIEDVFNPKYPEKSAEAVWDRRGAMSFPRGAPCTFHLKKEARQIWQKSNKVIWHVLGFGFEEQDRHDAFVRSELANVMPVLIDAKLTRQDCFEIIVSEGLTPPEAYGLGYPNANCRGCVKATSPTYWNHVRAVDPDVFDRRAEQSRRLGARLVRHKGERIFLDELPADAKGRPLNSLTMPECGLFCEERRLPKRAA
jgi:hypothetical protein